MDRSTGNIAAVTARMLSDGELNRLLNAWVNFAAACQLGGALASVARPPSTSLSYADVMSELISRQNARNNCPGRGNTDGAM